MALKQRTNAPNNDSAPPCTSPKADNELCTMTGVWLLIFKSFKPRSISLKEIIYPSSPEALQVGISPGWVLALRFSPR